LTVDLDRDGLKIGDAFLRTWISSAEVLGSAAGDGRVVGFGAGFGKGDNGLELSEGEGGSNGSGGEEEQGRERWWETHFGGCGRRTVEKRMEGVSRSFLLLMTQNSDVGPTNRFAMRS
jgi:hypothetical protein